MGFFALGGNGTLGLVTITIIISFIYVASIIFYRLFLHDLRSFPGPVCNRISNIPRAYHVLNGNLPFHVRDLHIKYGPVVRISPNELAFSDPQAWKDIYGHRSPGQEQFQKYMRFYSPFSREAQSILAAPPDEHSFIRRQLSPGFSDRSMRGQEPIIGSYVNLLIERLRSRAEDGTKALNMREWMVWTTFDIIGDLGFGSSFECLESGNYHPWVKLITHTIKQNGRMQALGLLGLNPIIGWLITKGFFTKQKQHMNMVKEKLLQRMDLGAERPDLIGGLISKNNKVQLPFEKLEMNAKTIIVAGSETTATLLTGAMFLLTTHPKVLEKLTQEVRSTFSKDDEISLLSVGKLNYMFACINESFRRYPPVGTGLPRQVPKGGGEVAGHVIPGGTVIAIWQWAINHDPRNFKNPMEFHPERFLGDPAFEGDKLEAVQPFSVGPRNCIGKNLAYAEMRLILAKIIFNFDMKIADHSRNWLENQKIYALWDKPALDVYLTPVY
ncbi:cytochrome p450 [Phlyctema vagabunda]|uniref:Cytochrome p450 n=1 Tax=Phlyctema vagabunda TaxID=108571 RepID=A0ABR4PAV2_9HELO